MKNMKTSFTGIKFIWLVTIMLLPNIFFSQYDITASDWNTVNKKAYLVTSNSNNSGYSQYRTLDSDKLYLANSGEWKYYIRPSIRKLLNDASSLSQSIDKDMNKLVSIADNWASSNTTKLKNEFLGQLSNCKNVINNIYLPLVDIHEYLVAFNDINTSFDYMYQAKYKGQSIKPSVSENANAIAKIRGTTEALKADLFSLIETLNGLENSEPLLVDITTASARLSWQNIKKGLGGYGSQIGGEGWDVNYVEYEGGSFTQVDDVTWIEMNSNKFTFQEYNRDLWSIYLYDKSRDVYIVLDQWKKKVRYKKGGIGDYSDFYSIISNRSKMNGKLLDGIVYLVGSKPIRQIVKVGKTWIESDLNSTANKNIFVETGRDDWSVYLWDASRNVRLGLDMHRMTVTYSDSNTPKRDQYKIAYGY